MLEYVPISPIGFAYISATVLSESYRSLEDLRETVNRFERKQCQLWTWKERGFIVISWHEEKSTKWMEVEQGVGKRFYTREGMELLKELAKSTECESIVCHAQKPLVIRLLKRLGFSFVNNETDKMIIQIGG